MTEWEQVRLTRELYNEVTKILEDKKFWVNEQDFVRDAVREKIGRIQEQQNGKEA